MTAASRIRRLAWPLALATALAAGAVYLFYARFNGPGRAAPAASAKKDRGGLDASRPIPVTAAPVASGDFDVYLGGLGTVTPLKTVVVRSRVDGQLMRVLFDEGQLVKAGDLLAEIDPRPFQVQLAQAEGQMVRDQALLANARIDLERYRTLLRQDSIAEQQVASQESLVQQYGGVVKFDQAQIDNAKLQLVYARITAPVGGRLGLRQVDPGNIVRASDANGLVVITQTRPIAVVFTIPQDNLPQVLERLRRGDRLPVSAWDREGRAQLAAGVLASIDNQIDPSTGTVKLKAQFANGDDRLFPNQFVNVRMRIDTRRDALTVPNAALQRGAQGMFVYVVNGDLSVSMRAVRPGPSEGERTVIDSGLRAGERVVIDGLDRLREGARVELAQRGAPSAPENDPAQKKGGRRKRPDGA